MVEYIRESKENKTWAAVNVNAIRKACREDDKPGRKRNERIQQRNVHRLPEQRSVLAYVASENGHSAHSEAERKKRLIHRVYNNVSNADFLYFFDVWLEIECKPRFASFHEEAVYRKDHHYHQQSQHHNLRHALQSVFKSYRTYQHCRSKNYRHKQYHCQRICKHGIKVLGYTGCVQIGKRPACSGEEIPQHPPGYRGVEHQQYIASNHRGNAVVMPL